MNCTKNCPLAIKIIAHLICLIALIIWSWIAIRKFIAQPIATYIHYTKGDNNVDIKFPHLTFCPQTDDRLKTFVELTEKNMRDDPKFDLKKLYYLNNEQVAGFVEESVLLHRREHINVMLSSFYPVFHFIYGPCIGFDADKLNVNIEDGVSASVTEFTLKLNLSIFDSDYMVVSFHSKLDSADAIDTNPKFYINKANPKITEINLQKKIISADSTRQFPCGNYDAKTCTAVEGNRKIIEMFNCKIAILYSGRHLEHYIDGYNDVPFCKDALISDALKVYLNQFVECKRSKPKACQGIIYTARKEEYEGNADGTAFLVIRFSNFEVEHYTSYIGYDIQSLVAELGGLLGMTLGISFVTAGDVLSDVLRKYFSK